MSRIDHLPDDVELLKQMVLERDAYLHSAQQQIEQLKAMLARLKDRRFGRSSEALDAQIEQLDLTLEELESFKASRPATVESLTPPEPRPTRAVTLAPHLPRESVVHEPAVSPGCTCPACGGELRSAGEDVTEVLERLPARYKLVRHVRPKMSCARCEKLIQAPA